MFKIIKEKDIKYKASLVMHSFFIFSSSKKYFSAKLDKIMSICFGDPAKSKNWRYYFNAATREPDGNLIKEINSLRKIKFK